MSQAATLLAGLTEDTSAYSSSETHIVIGNDRFITVPESLKRLAVQYDNNIETVTFECPRFWDEHDMFQMIPYINYLLPNGTTGQYKATNVSSDDSRIYFDWVISGNVTRHKGKLSFLVCIKKTDEDGNETNHWNSELNQDCYISEGLECTQTAVTRYPDIITQLLTRMDEVEAIATPEAMQTYANTWLEENRENLTIQSVSKTTTITLYADKWIETSSGYSQVVTMNGVTANSKIDLQPSPDQLASLVEDEASLVIGNNNGVVTVYAVGASPSSDMTMQVLITEVRSV